MRTSVENPSRAIVKNVVAYVYAKFGDDRLWNEKALADRKYDNNNNTKNNKNNVGGAGLGGKNFPQND